MSRDFKINQQIRASNVRLIGDDNEQLGVVSFAEAIAKAEEAGLDLIEVSPTDNPPVCKIADYGKYQYKKSKLEKKNKRKQKANEVKGIRLSIATGEHDIQVKIKQTEKFLKAHHTVKIALILRGREVSQVDMAIDKLNQFAEALSELAITDQPPKKQGYNVFMILSPKKS